MKLKFSADKKQWKNFIIICTVLLYAIALLIVNAESLAIKGEFSGLIPLKAFTIKYIGITLFFFIIGVGAILSSTGSFFFERDKGLGFTTEKKNKDGYSRWAKDEEIKKSLVAIDPKQETLKHAGIALISDGKKMWVNDGEAHTLVMGATGSGKTVIVSKPMIKILAKAGESMIVTDPKGELYENSANMLREKGYNVIVLNFRTPQDGNAWNPMALPYRMYKEGNTDKGTELLDDLAKNILYDEKSSNDPFWEGAGGDYFTALSLGLFEDAKEEQVNLNSMNLMSSLGEEKFGGPNNNYIKEYFNGKDPSRPAYINASGTVFAPEETKGGIISTFKQKVKIFSSRDNLSEMLSYSDFDMKEIGRQKTAVFLIIQDEKKTLHPLATIFIKQCYESLIDVAQECGGKLPYRTNFILDEFANMPPLKDVTTMVTAARSRLIRFTFIIQNYAQLTKVYGKDDAETIKGNCNVVYLISAELAALKEISELCGEVKSKEKEKTSSRPLITVSDLQRLKQFEIIVMMLRSFPYKTRFKTDFEVDWGKKYSKAIYTTREKKEIALFDIREFVKKKKQEERKNAMEGMDPMTPNPFGMPNGMPMGIPGGMPMGMMSGMNGGMPQFFNGESRGMPGNSNIDDLIKQIDSKIAMLEAEEQQEKAVSSKINKDKIINESVVEQNGKSIDKNANKKDLPIFEESIQEKNYSQENEEDEDDQFFDDFFSDE